MKQYIKPVTTVTTLTTGPLATNPTSIGADGDKETDEQLARPSLFDGSAQLQPWKGGVWGEE